MGTGQNTWLVGVTEPRHGELLSLASPSLRPWPPSAGARRDRAPSPAAPPAVTLGKLFPLFDRFLLGMMGPVLSTLQA